MEAGWPPTNTSTCVGRLPGVGATLSAATGPRPVPHNVIAWPGAAVAVKEVDRLVSLADKVLEGTPGPNPPLLTAKIPKLL